MSNLGFIGLGGIGAKRLALAAGMGHRVAFAVDPDPARRAAVPVDPSVIAASVTELTSRHLDLVDAVFVAVPHDEAASAAAWAIDRGAHVLCEKPLGISLAEAEGLRSRAAAKGVRLSSGFNYRFLPAITTLHGWLRGGLLGEIHAVHIHLAHGGRPGMDAEWKVQKRRAGGGALIDPGIHLLDLVRYLFGEPEVEHCDLARRFWNIDVEDNCSLRLRIGGAQVHVHVGLTSWKNIFHLEVFGRDGIALVTGRGGTYGPQKAEYVNRWFWNGDDKRMTRDFGVDDPSFELETAAFLSASAANAAASALSTADDGCAALRVVETAYAMAVAR